MRGIVSPFVIVALVLITTVFYLEYIKLKVSCEIINNETKVDIIAHRKVLNQILNLAEFKHRIYSCAKSYSCNNFTLFLMNVTNCAGTKIYYSNDAFYAYYNGSKITLNKYYMGCE